MPWSQTVRAVLACHREALWGVLSDPASWPTWCPRARGFRTRGPVRLIAAEAPRRLVLEQQRAAGPVRIVWTLTDVAAPGRGPLTRWEQRMEVDGPAAAVRGPRLARSLHSDVPEDAVRLAAAAGRTPDPSLLKVVIAGGTGALGRRLASDLVCRGHDVVVLSRRPDPHAPVRQVAWDGRTVAPWAAELADPARTAVVNLAGKLVDVRPTPSNITALRESRVTSTGALVAASREPAAPLARWVQASTTAIYSDAGERRVTESSPVPDPGLAQMTGVAVPWEAAASGANAAHQTVLRTSLVLDRGVPVMDRLLLVTRAGLGGAIGSGRQWMSWIHVEDWLAVVRAALGLVEGVALPAGPVIASAPSPVRNAEMMRALRRRLGRPWAPPTPTPLLRAGSVVLRTDPALAATGRHAISEVLDRAGFQFTHPTLDGALEDVLG